MCELLYLDVWVLPRLPNVGWLAAVFNGSWCMIFPFGVRLSPSFDL